MRRVMAFVLAGTAGVACSPAANDAFNCEGDGQCNAALGGTCTQAQGGNSFCAYPSPTCDGGSGLAFGDTAGASAGQCVSSTMGPTVIDGSTALQLDAFRQLDGPGTQCFGSDSDLQICLPAMAVTDDKTLTGTVYSHGGTVNGKTVTSICDSAATSPGGIELCVVAGHDLTLNDLTIEDPVGSFPIVFVA